MPRHPCAALKLLLGALAASFCATAAAAQEWPLAGRQGMILFVIVPTAMATDRAAYERQIERLCGSRETCFVNFYTNSKNVPVSLPLPDEIFQEPAAVLRRSGKQQVDAFRWSCRLGQSEPACF